MSRSYFSMAAGFGLASTLGLLTTMACSDDSGTTNSTGGATSGGSTSTGGGAGTFSTGGTSGGASSGGATSGGTGGGAMTAYPCAGKVPPSADITDFTMVPEWGNTAEFGGGHYVYPAGTAVGALTEASTAGDLNVTGMVSTYSGFGLYFAFCSDASAFTGVQFDISGNVGATGMIQFLIQTNEDYQIRPTEMKGACMFTPATEFSACVSPAKTIAVTEAVQTITVPFADLMGGKPTATVSPSQLIGLQWAFAWMEAGTPYAADVTVDNVKFVGGTGTGGSGGAGGSGGTGGSGGEGGAP
jgi:hypothetical protein